MLPSIVQAFGTAVFGLTLALPIAESRRQRGQFVGANELAKVAAAQQSVNFSHCFFKTFFKRTQVVLQQIEVSCDDRIKSMNLSRPKFRKANHTTDPKTVDGERSLATVDLNQSPQSNRVRQQAQVGRVARSISCCARYQSYCDSIGTKQPSNPIDRVCSSRRAIWARLFQYVAHEQMLAMRNKVDREAFVRMHPEKAIDVYAIAQSGDHAVEPRRDQLTALTCIKQEHLTWQNRRALVAFFQYVTEQSSHKILFARNT